MTVLQVVLLFSDTVCKTRRRYGSHVGSVKANINTHLGMRSLSPRMAPPEVSEEGSTASTATRCPACSSCRPRASMRQLLPAPVRLMAPLHTTVMIYLGGR